MTRENKMTNQSGPQHCDSRVIAIQAVVIKAVTDDEFIRDIEAHVFNFHRQLGFARFAKQHACPEARGLLFVDEINERVQRLAAVQDVINQQHMAIREFVRQRALHLHAFAFHARARIARHRNQFDAQLDGHLADEVGDENHRTCHHGDDDDVRLLPRWCCRDVSLQVLGYLHAKFVHALGDAVFFDECCREVVGECHGPSVANLTHARESCSARHTNKLRWHT